MSSLSAKDRVSLCSFTFSDSRRCRTPRVRNHPHFCFYHAQKEARAHAAQKLGKDLAYFFSGDYLSACDLSTALARLIPAVVCGDVKPKTAHTLAYLLQTLVQAIHISQDEYINAFGTDGWRKSVRNSVKGNYDYRFPPDPEPEPEVPASPAPETNLPSEPPQPAETPVSCHSQAVAQAFRPEEPAFSESQAVPSPLIPAPFPISAHAPQTPATHTAPSHTSGHPRRSERSCLNHAAPTTAENHSIPATQPARPVAPAAPSDNPQRADPSTPQSASIRDTRAIHFDHNCRLLVDGKPF